MYVRLLNYWRFPRNVHAGGFQWARRALLPRAQFGLNEFQTTKGE